MQKTPWWQWMILAAALLASAAVVWPPFDRTDANGRVVRRGKLRLGLDLRGGTSFTVEVDRDELRVRLKQKNPDLNDEALNAEVEREAGASRDVALEAIRNRIDGLGIAEPQIYPEGFDRIIVQMPGVDATKRDEARRAIQSVAFLEFRLVHRRSDEWVRRLFEEERVPRGFRIGGTSPDNFFYLRDPTIVPDEEMDSRFWADLRRFAPREGADFMLQRDEDEETRRIIWRPMYVERTPLMTGSMVQDARPDTDQLGRPIVELSFTRAGARKFTEIVRDYRPNGELNRNNERGRRLAIILDGVLRSAPEITDRFPHDQTIRSCEISGRGMDVREVRQLVNVLKTGALLAPMKITQEYSVDPTLGRASVRSGRTAILIGLALVAVFMLIYYRIAGVVADLALMLTALLLPLGLFLIAGVFAVFARTPGMPQLPTLTLPGIAGIALMFGMSVDANVLIYERIREELKAGKHLFAAILAGYEKAWVTILDANVTTVLAAIVMFWWGTGPVRGFAVMLTAGILVSLYTAVVVTRMAFNLLLQTGRLKDLRMLEWIRSPSVDFLAHRRLAAILSGILLAVTVGVFVVRGQRALGVEFTGGTALTVEFQKAVPDTELRAQLRAAGVRGEPLVQYRELLGDTTGRRLVVQVGPADAAAAEAALTRHFTDAGFRVVQKEEIGSHIGAELKRSALFALVWALIGMVVYISIRFEFAFAVGAIVALIHDAILSVGVFCLLGRQLSAPMIAVILTIIGYSVNDTIVVFDRIREGLKLWRGKSYVEVANLAINQTLGRTLLTAGTTILTVLALYLFGGGAINDFALLLLIGLVIGTYSSIFIATPVMLLWHRAPLPGPAVAAAAAGADRRTAHRKT